MSRHTQRRGRSLLWLGALLTMMLAPAPAVARVARSGTPAVAVTTFVQSVFTPHVLRLALLLARLNRAVAAAQQVVEGQGMLTSFFAVQAALLTTASHAFALLPLPELGLLPTLQLRCLLQDVAVSEDQLARPLEEAAALSAPVVEALNGAAYWPRVRSAVSLLRRAEGWLETSAHETSAHVILPGFEHGQLPLEQQLSLP